MMHYEILYFETVKLTMNFETSKFTMHCSQSGQWIAKPFSEGDLRARSVLSSFVPSVKKKTNHLFDYYLNNVFCF